jgi:hypothetical protein
MSKHTVSAAGGAMPAERRPIHEIIDDLAEVRGLIGAADMAASDLGPEQSDPMHALLSLTFEKISKVCEALELHSAHEREAANV